MYSRVYLSNTFLWTLSHSTKCHFPTVQPSLKSTKTSLSIIASAFPLLTHSLLPPLIHPERSHLTVNILQRIREDCPFGSVWDEYWGQSIMFRQLSGAQEKKQLKVPHTSWAPRIVMEATSVLLRPKWHTIPYIGHYFWPETYGHWSKVEHYVVELL